MFACKCPKHHIILPCPSIAPKRFWSGSSRFGLVQIISDMFKRFGQVQKWHLLVLIFILFDPCPKRFDYDRSITIWIRPKLLWNYRRTPKLIAPSNLSVQCHRQNWLQTNIVSIQRYLMLDAYRLMCVLFSLNNLFIRQCLPFSCTHLNLSYRYSFNLMSWLKGHNYTTAQ